MFGIGMPELILILAIALIVIGPSKLPDLAKSLGKAMGEFKKATRDLKDSMQIDSEFNELKTTFDDVKRDVKEGAKISDTEDEAVLADADEPAGAVKSDEPAGAAKMDESTDAVKMDESTDAVKAEAAVEPEAPIETASVQRSPNTKAADDDAGAGNAAPATETAQGAEKREE